MASSIHISPAYDDLARSLGIAEVDSIFTDSRLRVWRDLPDRDNSTLDTILADGRPIRLHVKRDKCKRAEPMALEARGISLLEAVGVSSAPLVAWGEAADGRTFVVTENLDGYTSADRLMETDADRTPVLSAMIDLAAALHNGGLHHRDLYANHFYMRPTPDGYHVRLIDTARVRRLPWFFRSRWIVKDIAQLIFSVMSYADASSIDQMIRDYQEQTGQSGALWFKRRVLWKVGSIQRHDQKLREKSPTRNLRLQDGQ